MQTGRGARAPGVAGATHQRPDRGHQRQQRQAPHPRARPHQCPGTCAGEQTRFRQYPINAGWQL